MIHIISQCFDPDKYRIVAVLEGPVLDMQLTFDCWVSTRIGPQPRVIHGCIWTREYYDWVKKRRALQTDEFIAEMELKGFKRVDFGVVCNHFVR